MGGTREGWLERTAQAIANVKDPRHRDARSRRRTLAHRSRKDYRHSFTITDKTRFVTTIGTLRRRSIRSRVAKFPRYVHFTLALV